MSTKKQLYTIKGFCEQHSCSRSWIYLMWSKGLGPAVTKIGVKKFISAEAAHAWRNGLPIGSTGSTVGGA